MAGPVSLNAKGRVVRLTHSESDGLALLLQSDSPAHLQTHETARGGPPGTRSPPKAIKAPRERRRQREGVGAGREGRERRRIQTTNEVV